jgi:hypothetical protein
MAGLAQIGINNQRTAMGNRNMTGMKSSIRCLRLLSQVLLGRDGNYNSNIDAPLTPPPDSGTSLSEAFSSLVPEEFGEFWTLATANHVILRSFLPARRVLAEDGSAAADWFDRAIVKEQKRVHHALAFLSPICRELEEAGEVVVIKSLDHWPDLGSDLDLYTNAESSDMIAILRERFKAQVAERSWGDRLANKWNFIVPGLPELVEVHVARLGQTGEQIAITRSLIERSGIEKFGSHRFRVPAAEDRIVISTLQRMYRHFYVRLCDIVDNAKLVDSGAVNYPYLRSLARSAGLWDGLATYLTIVSGYVKSYRGEGLPLPSLVTTAAQFGSDLLRFKRKFLRVPIFPHAVLLYVNEWKRLLLNGEIENTLRLSLLPGLATAAALELKITGSDKGIW